MLVSERDLTAKRPIVIKGFSREVLAHIGRAVNVGIRSIVGSPVFLPALQAINYDGETPELPTAFDVFVAAGSHSRFRVESLITDSRVWDDPIWVAILSCESPYLADKVSSQDLRRWFFGSRLNCRRGCATVAAKGGKLRRKKIRSGSLEDVLAKGFETDPLRRVKLYLEVFCGDVLLRPLFSWEIKISFSRNADGQYTHQDVSAIGTCVWGSQASAKQSREIIGRGLLGARVITPVLLR